MSIATTVAVVTAALWQQGDIRDPLGVWGSRLGVTGDATGGEIKVTAQVPIADSAAYMFTVYSITLTQLTGSLGAGVFAGARLLTNWPDVDPVAGVQGYATFSIANIVQGIFTAPTTTPLEMLLKPNDRFILLFDPRPGRGSVLELVEMKWGENVDAATYSFETYGYYWDRSVLNAPGGPRHPGSS